MADISKDELQPEQTEGFKVSEAKTIDEYTKLGKEIEIHPLLALPHQAIQISSLLTSLLNSPILIPLLI